MVSNQRVIHGYCTQCAAHCGVVAEVQDDRLVRIRADREHPNKGICFMGASARR